MDLCKRKNPPGAKKILAAVFAAGIVSAASAQSWSVMRHGHYEIESSAGPEKTALLAVELEQRFETYNRLFRFDPSRLSKPLKVRLFSDRGEYLDYAGARLRRTAARVNPQVEPAGAVYFHFTQAGNRELTLLEGEEGDLPFQSFVQFLRAFIPNPPSWMREGFAVYFAATVFNRDTKTLEYAENLSWLSRIKAAKERQYPIEEILLADTRGAAPEDFQARSWALVSFFLSDRDNYYRMLIDALTTLKPANSAAENSTAVYNRILRFTGMEALQTVYAGYINGRKTFSELIEDGQKAYAAKDYQAAATVFQRAVNQHPGRWESYYYLGLVAHMNKDYAAAELFYAAALVRNPDRGLLQYARGVNAVAAGRKEDALRFLEEAAGSVKYRDAAEELARRLK
jgi:tetratricopeptide (TPR) repeat protein